jgi:alpha-mannosidase
VKAGDGTLHFVVAQPFATGRIEDTRESVRLTESAGEVRLENGRVAAILTTGGSLRSLIHEATGREALAGAANRFVLYDDRPTQYEAWDIDPFALETGREAGGAKRRDVVSKGPLRAEARFEHAIGAGSRIVQTVRLDAGCDHLEFDTVIDWHERRTLLKAIFPLAIKAPRATYETMCGAVERPTHASTDADLAQFEVPGHRWADLSDPGFGVSLLTDSRYGYATFDNVMSLSLLRGTMSPDANADLGSHHFRYALFPHAGDWRDGGTVAQALRFNRPLLWNGAPAQILERPLVSSDATNVVIDTLKPAEDGKGWVVRLYESHGTTTAAKLSFGVPVRSIHRSNTLEDRGDAVLTTDGTCKLALRPFQIVTLRVG